MLYLGLHQRRDFQRQNSILKPLVPAMMAWMTRSCPVTRVRERGGGNKEELDPGLEGGGGNGNRDCTGRPSGSPTTCTFVATCRLSGSAHFWYQHQDFAHNIVYCVRVGKCVAHYSREAVSNADAKSAASCVPEKCDKEVLSRQSLHKFGRNQN